MRAAAIRCGLAPQLGAAHGHGGHLRIDPRPRALAARVTHGRRSFERDRRVEHLPALVLVGRRHHDELRDAAQETQVERALVGRAVAADESAAVDRERDRQVLQAYVVDQLVVGALQERRVNRDDRPQAFAGKARGERHGVLFGDGDVEIAVGKTLRELDQSRAFTHRGRDADDARIELSLIHI